MNQQFHQQVKPGLGSVSCRTIPTGLSQTVVDNICTKVGRNSTKYDTIVGHLNGLPYVCASDHPYLQQDDSVLILAHPLLFQTFKPVATTGDSNCLYHTLSLALTGTET